MTDFTMPSLGADMEDAKLVEWLVKPGDSVHTGDVVAVIETHKGAIDVEIFDNGRVTELCASEGETVAVGGLLARIQSPGAVPASTPPPKSETKPPAYKPAPQTAATQPAFSITRAGRAKVSPAARKRAAELGIDPETLSGTGVDGAVSFADVEFARASGVKQETATAPAPRSGFDPAEMRRAIAAAVTRSKRDIPHYYLANTVDMAAALDWVHAYNEGRPPAERMLAATLLLKATALGLRKVPQLNGFWKKDGFFQGKGIHVGWAISLRGGGLVSPAIHDVDTLDLPDLMSSLRDVVERARSGGLRSSELMDATVTVTSLGDRGADSVTGVIYPPQVAIIGFGRVRDRPWVVGDTVQPRPLVDMTLAADHRASDGHAGGRLLYAIEKYLREPESL